MEGGLAPCAQKVASLHPCEHRQPCLIIHLITLSRRFNTEYDLFQTLIRLTSPIQPRNDSPMVRILVPGRSDTFDRQ